MKAAGYRYVALDLGGFRSGSLNEGLAKRATARLIDAVQIHEPAE